jgi:chitodextrinase
MKNFLSQPMKQQFQKLALSGLLGLTSLGAFAQNSKEIGSVNSLKQLLNGSANQTTARTSSVKNLVLETPNQVFQAKINSTYNNFGYETFAGKILNHGWADFHVQFKNGKASGLIVLFDEKKAYEFTTNAQGNVIVVEKPFDQTVSVDNFGKEPLVQSRIAAVQSNVPGTTAEGNVIPLLQSNPAASTVVYLDFDGEYVANTPWNGGVAIDAQKPNATEQGITEIWEMVAEDFAPFNLNVTTNRAVYDAAQPGRRQMVIFTPTSTAAPGAGGVAFVGGFAWQPDLPCWVFNSPLDPSSSAEAASHEVGHTFGLGHDGRDFPDGTHEEYYGGHNNWGPIVGVAYGRSVSQFSKGEYLYASNTQDDLEVIASSANAFGYRTDDHGSTANTATQLLYNNYAFNAAGIISKTNDKDYFKFSSPGATFSININNKYAAYSNLNVLAQILNANQQVVYESNPTTTQGASFTDISLAAGDYYLVIDGVGEGDANTGYTEYGSLGEYVIAASLVPNVVTCTDPDWNALTAYSGGAKVSFNGNIYTAKWWTQNNQPDLNTGEGKPWNLVGPCPTSNRAPVVTFTAPAKNAVFALGTTVTLVADAVDPDGTISKVEFLNASDVVVFTDNTAPYEFPVANLPVGLYVYKAKAYDNKNLASTVATNNFEIKVSNVAPIISISSSLQGQTFYEYPSDGRKIDVLLTQQNPIQAPIDSVKYIIIDTQCNGAGCTTVRKFTTKIAPFDLYFDPIYTLYGSAYNVNTEIDAIAFSKGIASEQKTIYVKVKPLPELTIVSPANNTNVSKNIATLPIDVTVNSNQLAIDSVVYTVYDTKTTGMSGITNTRKFVRTAPFDLDLPVIGGNTFTRIFALAYGDGGKFSKSQQIQVNYNEVPTVYITDPVSTFKYNVGGSVTIKASVGDVDGTISKVEIYSPHIPGSKVTLTAPPYEATFNNLPSSGNNGALPFVVVATDNQNGVNGADINVTENRLPTITITSPVAVNGINPKYKVGGSITIAANIADQDGTITKVEFTKGGTTTGMVTLTAAPYTATFNNLPAPSPDGSYWFNVKAYDNNGGVKDQLVVVYKNRVPSVAITKPINNAEFTVGSTIAIGALTFDPDWTSGKVEYFNGTTKLGEVVINSALPTSEVNYNWTNVAAGTYNLTVKATDDMAESAISSVVTVVVKPQSTCSAQLWNASTAYTGGAIVQFNGIKYVANWWTQGNQPDFNNGPAGSGKPWTSQGACAARLSNETAIINSTLAVFPNPFNEVLTIEAPVNVALAQVVILNLNGEVQLSTTAEASNGVISASFATSNLVSGIYVVQIIAGNEVLTYRVSK